MAKLVYSVYHINTVKECTVQLAYYFLIKGDVKFLA